MRAEKPPTERHGELQGVVSTPFAVVLMVAAFAAAGGWLYTVRELNRLVAYEVVRSVALRQAGPVQAHKAPAAPDRAKQQQITRRPGADDD